MTNQKTLDYIKEHIDNDVRQLALRGSKDPEVDMTFALDQIAGRQKAKTKIPSWAAIDGIIYPPHLSMEQCSSEATARYKAHMAGEGHTFVDLTAGYGVDTAFIAQGFQQAVHVELQESLCTISSENYKLLGLHHIRVVCDDGRSYLHTLDHADLLFIDPARRDEYGGRTYGIADCTPNVLEMLDEMEKKADRIVIKLSPMLDWRKAVEDLGHVHQVHIVSVENECKELLMELKNGNRNTTSAAPSLPVICVNLLSDGTEDHFEFDALAPSSTMTDNLLQEELRYLYEPNASIMKAGCFHEIAARFQLTQLDRNSHLFVSATKAEHFPGRCFVIENTISMNKRELKEALKGIDRANIAVRNFPMSVADLRKRLKLKDGGDIYIFATSVANKGHRLFICQK